MASTVEQLNANLVDEGLSAASGVSRVPQRVSRPGRAVEINGEMTYGTPKTHKCRSVPVPRSLVDALAEHVAGKGPDELVFTTPRGDVMRNHNFRRRVFVPAAEQIGCPD